ncbi:MAG: M64 family metallo-endopeptidase [Alistipes sp.]|nr:M64 family metallo-endopeptidase [Alistipes sp.]
MKKILLLLPLVFFTLSCSDNDDNGIGTGSIQFNLSGAPDMVDGSRATPTTEFTTYTVELQGPSSRRLTYPSGGRIDGLQPGSYKVTLSSHSGGVPSPSFDNQYYTGTVNATVKPGEVTPVSLTLTQGNSGVYFVYDSSLDEAGLDPVPTVTAENGLLQFSGLQKEGKGYFHPGELTVTLSQGGTSLSLGDDLVQRVTLEDKELCEITLYHGQLKSPGLSLHPSVQPVNTPTRRLSFNVGIPSVYSHGEAVISQQATAGAPYPVHLVVIGDGFTQADYLYNGNFDRIADEAIEGFFMVEPYPTYRDYFQVTKIAAHSRESGSTILEDFNWAPYNKKQNRNTFFSTEMNGGSSTLISCNYTAAVSFIRQYHPDGLTDLNHVTILMVINVEAYAGTCAIYYSGNSLAMCPVDTKFKELVAHECGGHGFGRLLDEYIYYTEPFPDSSRENIMNVRNNYGQTITHGEPEWSYGANVTFTNNRDEVHWKHYFTRTGYNEVGLYQGADMYSIGIWRPEYNSCMNNNVAYFNAPSREAIVRRITKIAGEDFDYESYYANEKQITYPFTYSGAQAHGSVDRPPLAQPILIPE